MGRMKKQNERSKAVANQGLFYAGTFAFVWLFGTITRFMQLIGLKAPWPIIFLFAIFTPSQGFFNFLVYIRPRILKYFAVKKKKEALKKKAAGESASGFSSTVSMIRVSGMEDDEVASKNESSSVVSAVMVEPSSTTPRSVPEGIITTTPPHTPYQRRSSNGSIKRLSFESGLSKCDESIEETAETTESQGEDVPKKRDSKVRFQAANIDVVDEKEDLSTDSDVDLETMSALASLTSAASGGGGGGGGGADGAEGGTTTTITPPIAAA